MNKQENLNFIQKTLKEFSDYFEKLGEDMERIEDKLRVIENRRTNG